LDNVLAIAALIPIKAAAIGFIGNLKTLSSHEEKLHDAALAGDDLEPACTSGAASEFVPWQPGVVMQQGAFHEPASG
jgi:hypothetical protein